MDPDQELVWLGLRAGDLRETEDFGRAVSVVDDGFHWAATAYIPAIAYYLLNFTSLDGVAGQTPREQVAALLRAKMWGVDAGEPHRAALAPGDLALIYIGPPEASFVGRAELASAVRDWTPDEAQVYPGESQGGVLLANVEEWDPPVPMEAVVARVDPTGANPYVRANARDGFKNAVVLITEDEHKAVLAVQAEMSV